MTDRYIALTVILEKEIRSDDAEPYIEAIKMIKGVRDVKPIVADPGVWFAQEEAKHAIRMKIFKALE